MALIMHMYTHCVDCIKKVEQKQMIHFLSFSAQDKTRPWGKIPLAKMSGENEVSGAPKYVMLTLQPTMPDICHLSYYEW